MKLIDKLAKEFILYAEMNFQCGSYPATEAAFKAGFLAAREIAAEKILASVDLKSIEDAGLLDDASINCGLQAKHDHDICMSLGEEEVE